MRYLAEMCWQEAETALREPRSVIVIPVGSTEQHGCVGPLGTDWLVPDEFCRRMKDLDDVLVVPTVAYGVATHHINFPGTMDISLETMIGVMRGILESLFRHGARRFVVVNGHGGNDPAIEKAALEIYRRGGLVALIDWWSVAPRLDPDWVTGHGDAQEVSAVMAFRPELIRKEFLLDNEAPPLTPELLPTHINTCLFQGAPVKIIREIRDTVNTGGLGGREAKEASVEWGQAMMDGTSRWINEFIEEFRRAPLPRKLWN